MSGPSRRLLAAQLVGSVGDGAFYVTSVLFLTRVVGLSGPQVGLGLTAGWAVGFLVSTPAGALGDRRGLRGVAVLCASVTAGALLALLGVSSMAGFVAVLVVYGSAQSSLAAVRQALLAALVVPAERTVVRARLQATQNAGLAVGASVGGLALVVDTASSYRAVLGLDALAFLVTAFVLLRLPAVPAVVQRAGAPRLEVLRDRPYAVLAGLNAVMLLYMPLLSVVLPVWVVERAGAPAWLVSALFVLNTLGVMAGQVRVARRVHDLATAGRAVRLAGLVMLASCVAFALSVHVSSTALVVGVLVVAASLQVLAEMLSASGVWHVAFALAPDDRQGQYQGFFASGVPVARMVGPVLLSTLLLSDGTAGWLVLGGLFVLAGSAFALQTSRVRVLSPA